MHVVCVSNPSSGSSDEDQLAAVRAILARLGPTDIVASESLESFEREVVDAAGDADLVVVAGGDGTLNCTINSLTDHLGDVMFGLVPMGTGNDLARTLALPDDPIAAAEAVTSGSRRTIDVWKVSSDGRERLFVNASIGGFPVEVNEAIDDAVKRRLGPFAFWWGAAKTLGDLPSTRVELGGRVLEDCVAVGVGNGRTCGGGMQVWPDADPTDGLLDGCALPAASVVEAVKRGVQVKLGRHEGETDVVTMRDDAIRIDSDPPIELNVDGELIDLRTPVEFTFERKLTMLVP